MAAILAKLVAGLFTFGNYPSSLYVVIGHVGLSNVAKGSTFPTSADPEIVQAV